jgi:hypothetical protein
MSTVPTECTDSIRSLAPLDGKRRALVAASGSVAVVKLPEIVRGLVDRGFYVDVVLTEAADSLLKSTYNGEVPAQTLEALRSQSTDGGGVPQVSVWRDEDEWRAFGEVGKDSVLHIDLAKRNWLMLVTPCCANTLAQVTPPPPISPRVHSLQQTGSLIASVCGSVRPGPLFQPAGQRDPCLVL